MRTTRLCSDKPLDTSSDFSFNWLEVYCRKASSWAGPDPRACDSFVKVVCMISLGKRVLWYEKVMVIEMHRESNISWTKCEFISCLLSLYILQLRLCHPSSCRGRVTWSPSLEPESADAVSLSRSTAGCWNLTHGVNNKFGIITLQNGVRRQAKVLCNANCPDWLCTGCHSV